MSTKIEKNGIYAYTEQIKEKGLAIAVLDHNTEKVEGLRMLLDKAENFSMSYDAFCIECDKGFLAFVEILPKFVIKDLKKIYAANLKKS